MSHSLLRRCACWLLFTLAAPPVALAQLGGVPKPDVQLILAAAKSASGGSAWDKLLSQHSKVTIQAGGFSGHAERWSDMKTGFPTWKVELLKVRNGRPGEWKLEWKNGRFNQLPLHKETIKETQFPRNRQYA
jgi:hypothetical protein